MKQYKFMPLIVGDKGTSVADVKNAIIEAISTHTNTGANANMRMPTVLAALTSEYVPPLKTRLRTVYEKFAINPHDPGEWEVIIGPFAFVLDVRATFTWTGGDEHYKGEYQDVVHQLRIRTRTLPQWQDECDENGNKTRDGDGYDVGSIDCEIDELPSNPTIKQLITELKTIFASDYFSRILDPRYKPVWNIQTDKRANEQTLQNLVQFFTAGAYRYPGGLRDVEEYQPGRDRGRKFHAGMEVFTDARYKRPITTSDTTSENVDDSTINDNDNDNCDLIEQVHKFTNLTPNIADYITLWCNAFEDVKWTPNKKPITFKQQLQLFQPFGSFSESCTFSAFSAESMLATVPAFPKKLVEFAMTNSDRSIVIAARDCLLAEIYSVTLATKPDAVINGDLEDEKLDEKIDKMCRPFTEIHRQFTRFTEEQIGFVSACTGSEMAQQLYDFRADQIIGDEKYHSLSLPHATPLCLSLPALAKWGTSLEKEIAHLTQHTIATILQSAAASVSTVADKKVPASDEFSFPSSFQGLSVNGITHFVNVLGLTAMHDKFFTTAKELCAQDSDNPSVSSSADEIKPNFIIEKLMEEADDQWWHRLPQTPSMLRSSPSPPAT